MENSTLPKIVWPQGGTALKAFTFDPSSAQFDCELWSGAREASPESLTNFIQTNTTTSSSFFKYVQIIPEVLESPVVLNY